MIVPFSKAPSGSSQAPQAMPPEPLMLMALAQMHESGRLGELQDQAQGQRAYDTLVQGIRQKVMKESPPGKPDRPLSPGERLPDPNQGGLNQRDVRGM